MPRRTTPPEPPADENDESVVADTSAETPAEPVTEPTSEPAAEAPSDLAPGASEPAPEAPRTESAFFAWLRRIDLPRRHGWLGGVCAGIAEKIGIDPILVRGVVVVVAVLGAPVVLLYAVAWFLLPDEQGTIHAQELGRGRVTRAFPGIVALFLLSFLPLAQGFWFAGSLYWGDPSWFGAVLRVVWTAAVIAAVVVLVVWLARRAAASDIPTTPATTDDRPETVPTFPADAAGRADAGVPVAAALAASVTATAGAAAPVAAPAAAPGEPPAPPSDASADELAAWKQSQDEWQKQRAAWATEQRRSARERSQAEAHQRALAAAEAARERARIRKLTRPRASAGVVFLVWGVALVAGALAALAASNTATTQGSEWAIGAAVCTLVLGAGIVAVGLARRRSGFLSLLGILSVPVLIVALLVPTDRQLLPLGGIWDISTSRDGRYAMLAGSTSIVVEDHDRTVAPVVDLWQFAGSVNLHLDEGATVELDYTTDAPSTGLVVEEQFRGTDGGRDAIYRVRDGRLQLTIGSGAPDLVLHLWAGRATSVWVNVTSSPETPVELSPEPDERSQWTADDTGSVTAVPVPPGIVPPELQPTPIPTEGALP